MAVIIENQQVKVNITDEMIALIKGTVDLCLKHENFKIPAEVSISLVDNFKIQEINNEFRNIDRPTDVLSFPMLEFSEGDIKNTCGDFNLDENLLLLGDIVISLEMAKQQSDEYGHSFEREVAFLLTHGVFHLLGYDHIEEADEKIMIGNQEAILEEMGLKKI